MRQPMSQHWTDDQNNLLREFVRTGVTPLRAAAALKRRLISVKSRARLLGTPIPTYAQARRLRAAKFADALRSATEVRSTNVMTDSQI